MELEICIICDDATGNAGKFDGSLYPTLSSNYGPAGLQIGDEIGPLCGECNLAFERLNLVEQ